MKKIQVGNVFEIATSKGKGYFQYVYKNERTNVELIRVFPNLYMEEPQNIADLVLQKEAFFVHFALKAAYRIKIVRLIGNYEVPEGLEIPPKQMRTVLFVRGEFIFWQIVDYDTWKRKSFKELTEEQKKLSPWSIWNATLLIERMLEGWTPEKWNVGQNTESS